ncbi:MAG: nickel pincer cofactor biosynthesis protein LarB [Chloroflexi bacterium]|nr:nickel pincer cofactor biosynthesis protein LarB [Chloroflexota bacterium]
MSHALDTDGKAAGLHSRDGLYELLERVRAGEISLEKAADLLAGWPTDDLGFARVDHARSLRQGMPEVVFAEGKTPEQVASIMRRIAEGAGAALATRASREAFEATQALVPAAQYHPLSRVITVGGPLRQPDEDAGLALIVSAGTSDLPVAEEAALTAWFLGARVERVHDVGVSGLHRLLAARDQLLSARVIVVVAGMEGALPSVVGGLVSCPVIAVPTSVGYGASFGGLAALLAMLNSCAPGVAVVNIDNGFGAGVLAYRIASGGN